MAPLVPGPRGQELGGVWDEIVEADDLDVVEHLDRAHSWTGPSDVAQDEEMAIETQCGLEGGQDWANWGAEPAEPTGHASFDPQAEASFALAIRLREMAAQRAFEARLMSRGPRPVHRSPLACTPKCKSIFRVRAAAVAEPSGEDEPPSDPFARSSAASFVPLI